MNFAPIVLFTYNRPLHTRLTIEALLKNQYANESDLIIFSDAPKTENDKIKVLETRQYLKTICGFRSLKIVERIDNYGLANNIIDGVTTIVNKYGRIIVLEDDLITSSFFIRYMNEALSLYENASEVACIHGYIYPSKGELPETFFIKGADCYGWGTWKRAWSIFNSDGEALLKELKERNLTKAFDFESSYPYTRMLKRQIRGEISSWAIRWYASAFLKGMFTLYPGRSLIKNNGIDGSGTNCETGSEFDVELSNTPIAVARIPIKESEIGKKRFIYYFRHAVLWSRIKKRLKKILHL
jgi:hypothetical protein